MTQLYVIADEYRQAIDLIMNEDYPSDAEAVQKLNEIGESLDKKGVAIAQLISNMGADLDAIKAEKERLAKRQKVLESRMQWMNSYLKGNMEMCRINEISCPYFSIKIKNCPQSVEVMDKSQLPEEYLNTKTVITENKLKMRDDMKNGIEIPGARLIQNTWLDIR